ncbi:MAG: hypothetical protein CHACPFDD_01701 [Phycisphaerae bacterium]|nr:hypothetical protein [Phycisphaerae bacterium]
MSQVRERPAAPPAAPHVVALHYAVRGDLRWLSHHDQMRMLARALVRARIAVRYSAGFNPRAQLALPLARPLGVASEAELAIVELDERIGAEVVFERMAAVLPADAPLLAVRSPVPQRSPQPRAATYETDLSAEESALLEARIEGLLGQNEVWITRESGPEKPTRRVDVRPFVGELNIDRQVLVARLLTTNRGTIRPGELLMLLGLTVETHIPLTTRVSVEWDQGWNAAPEARCQPGKELDQGVTREEEDAQAREESYAQVIRD